MIGSYARTSTEDKTTYSTTGQLRQNRAKANQIRPNEEIKEYVDDGYSGEFLDRPALSQLRQDVKDGIITLVICFDPDRLARNLMNQLIITDEFQRQNVDIIFVSGEYEKTPEGHLFYSMRGAIAEFEKAKINERMSRGRREKARAGKVLRDFQVYGYKYDQEQAKMVIDKDEAEVVRLVFDLFTKPNDLVKGINGIAKYLTRKGIPTKRGASVWHRQVVRQMLMNRAYIGEFYQNRWNTEGMLGNKHRPKDERVPMRERPKEEWIPIPCPPIVDEWVFEHAESLLEESRRRWAKQGKRQYLLSGLLRCANCGNTMTGRRTKNWGKHIYMYSDEKNTSGAKNSGCGRKIRCEEIDKEVWEWVQNFINNPQAIAEHSPDETPNFDEAEKERLQAELERTKKGRKRLINLLAEGEDIGHEEIRDSLRELKTKEEKIVKDLDAIDGRIQRIKGDKKSVNLLEMATDYYLNSNGEWTLEQKQELIRYLIREIRVKEDGIEIYTF